MNVGFSAHSSRWSETYFVSRATEEDAHGTSGVSQNRRRLCRRNGNARYDGAGRAADAATAERRSSVNSCAAGCHVQGRNRSAATGRSPLGPRTPSWLGSRSTSRLAPSSLGMAPPSLGLASSILASPPLVGMASPPPLAPSSLAPPLLLVSAILGCEVRRALHSRPPLVSGSACGKAEIA